MSVSTSLRRLGRLVFEQAGYVHELDPRSGNERPRPSRGPTLRKGVIVISCVARG